MRAASRESLIADFVALAHLLELPGQDGQDEMLVVQAVKRWMRQNEGWLLILDNADDLQPAADFLPTGGTGHVLLTTRTQATGRVAVTLSVEKMDRGESILLLLRRAKLLDVDEPLDNAPRAVRVPAQKIVQLLDVAESLNNLAMIYDYQGQYALSEPLHRRALTIRERELGPDHPRVANGLTNLGWLNVTQGKYEQAEPLYRRALDIREQGLGPVHPLTARSLNNLAHLYAAQGRYEQAESMHQRALAILEQVLDPEHPTIAESLHHLAHVYFLTGAYEQAEPLYRRALMIEEGKTEPNLPHVAHNLHRLAQLYQAQGRYVEARLTYQRALAIYIQSLGTEHPDTASVRADYTGFLSEMQQTMKTTQREGRT